MGKCRVSSRADLAYARQHARKRFGSAACAECGQGDELTLQEFEGRVLCRRCTLLAQGLAPTEDDHPFGKRNSPRTRAMDADDHALVTALQGYWPRATQRNKHGSTMLTIAAGLRRLGNLLALLREHIDTLLSEVERMARWLERAHAYLERKLGPAWERDVPMDEDP